MDRQILMEKRNFTGCVLRRSKFSQIKWNSNDKDSNGKCPKGKLLLLISVSSHSLGSGCLPKPTVSSPKLFCSLIVLLIRHSYIHEFSHVHLSIKLQFSQGHLVLFPARACQGTHHLEVVITLKWSLKNKAAQLQSCTRTFRHQLGGSQCLWSLSLLP